MWKRKSNPLIYLDWRHKYGAIFLNMIFYASNLTESQAGQFFLMFSGESSLLSEALN